MFPKKYIFFTVAAIIFFCPFFCYAATEFISTIRATGGDYSMLSTWEAAVQCNLTASTTVVYSGTGTGGISAGATLELFRGGVYQNITALKIATTSDQLLVQTFTGDYKVLQSGDQWRKASSTANMWTVSSAGLGDSAIAVAECYNDWSNDWGLYNNVIISGWTTSADNYIKIYAPEEERHNGTAGSGFRISSAYNDGTNHYLNAHTIAINLVDYVTIEGIEIAGWRGGGSYNGIRSGAAGTDNTTIRNCIIHNSYDGQGYGIQFYDSNNARVLNNIIYDCNIGIGNTLYSESGYYYNNTIIDCNTYSIYNLSTTRLTIKNNISQNCPDGYSSTFNATSDYNLSDLAGDAPGANSKNSTNVAFVDEANDDFHLAGNDSAARNAGTDLSADANLPFSDDIDGQTRAGTWDIGADEVAENIYRSAGPGKTAALANGASYGALTISGSTATFAIGLPDEVGAGDALQYDDDGDGDIDASDSIVFIHSRTNSTTYEVKTASGAVPTAVVNDADWSLFRAYISLANAETGTENTGIDADLRNFDSWTLGKDISSSTGSNEQWNIACYANGTTADTSSVTINNWTTNADNYIKIYTPYATTDVGTSQRHGGTYDTSKYRLEVSSNSVLTVSENYVRIEGLQFKITLSSASIKNAVLAQGESVNSTTDIRISHCIIQGAISGTSNNSAGIVTWYASGSATVIVKVWNNIIYGFKNGGYTDLHGIRVRLANYYAYNNTIVNCRNGVYKESGSAVVKNTITQDCTDGFLNIADGSNYNLSDLAGDAPGANSKNSTNVAFVDEANDDFHLAPNDYSAVNAGADLSANSYLDFTDDIDGETRPVGVAWDIGADETALTKFRFDGGQMKIRGTIKFE